MLQLVKGLARATLRQAPMFRFCNSLKNNITLNNNTDTERPNFNNNSSLFKILSDKSFTPQKQNLIQRLARKPTFNLRDEQTKSFFKYYSLKAQAMLPLIQQLLLESVKSSQSKIQPYDENETSPNHKQMLKYLLRTLVEIDYIEKQVRDFLLQAEKQKILQPLVKDDQEMLVFVHILHLKHDIMNPPFLQPFENLVQGFTKKDIHLILCLLNISKIQDFLTVSQLKKCISLADQQLNEIPIPSVIDLVKSLSNFKYTDRPIKQMQQLIKNIQELAANHLKNEGLVRRIIKTSFYFKIECAKLVGLVIKKKAQAQLVRSKDDLAGYNSELKFLCELLNIAQIYRLELPESFYHRVIPQVITGLTSGEYKDQFFKILIKNYSLLSAEQKEDLQRVFSKVWELPEQNISKETVFNIMLFASRNDSPAAEKWIGRLAKITHPHDHAIIINVWFQIYRLRLKKMLNFPHKIYSIQDPYRLSTTSLNSVYYICVKDKETDPAIKHAFLNRLERKTQSILKSGQCNIKMLLTILDAYSEVPGTNKFVFVHLEAALVSKLKDISNRTVNLKDVKFIKQKFEKSQAGSIKLKQLLETTIKSNGTGWQSGLQKYQERESKFSEMREKQRTDKIITKRTENLRSKPRQDLNK